jgi:hypothetical protein
MSLSYLSLCLAGTSLLTSRALLLGSLKDYPLSLVLAQLSVFLVLRTQTFAHKANAGAKQLPLRREEIGALWFLVITVLSCICFISAYKTLRFAGSLPTATLLLTMRFSTDHVDLSLIARTTRLMFTVARAAIFICGFALVLLWDYRLNVTSRDMSLAFLVSSHVITQIPGFAAWLQDRSCVPDFLKADHRPITTHYWLPLLMALIGVIAYLDESSKPFVGTISTSNCTVLLANLVVTAAAILFSGNSTDSDTLNFHRLDLSGSRTLLDQDIPTTLAFSGFVSLGSCLLLESSAVLSPWQFVGYLTALVVSRSRSVERVAPEYPDVNSHTLLEDQTFLLQRAQDPKKSGCATGYTNARDAYQYNKLLSYTIACAVIFWSLFAYNASLEPVALDRIAVSIDTSVAESMDLDIVIAAYSRPGHEIAHEINSIVSLTNIQNHTIRIYIYNKGAETSLLEQSIQEDLFNTTEWYMEELDNLGREGGTYLHHIVSHWDALARHTLFVQEQAHDFALLKRRIADYLVPETGFLSLSYEGKIWEHCEHLRAGSWPGVTTSIARVASMVNSSDVCYNPVLTFRGQFLASNTRIRSNDRDMYAKLLSDLVNAESWMHAPELLQSPWVDAESDSLVDPVFGYTLERLWGVIMRCSDSHIAAQSPSLLGWYMRSVWFGQKVPIEDVQCLDGHTRHKA